MTAPSGTHALTEDELAELRAKAFPLGVLLPSYVLDYLGAIEATIAARDEDLAITRRERDDFKMRLDARDEEIARLTAITVAYWARFGAVPEDGTQGHIAMLEAEVKAWEHTAKFYDRMEEAMHKIDEAETFEERGDIARAVLESKA